MKKHIKLLLFSLFAIIMLNTIDALHAMEKEIYTKEVAEKVISKVAMKLNIENPALIQGIIDDVIRDKSITYQSLLDAVESMDFHHAASQHPDFKRAPTNTFKNFCAQAAPDEASELENDNYYEPANASKGAYGDDQAELSDDERNALKRRANKDIPYVIPKHRDLKTRYSKHTMQTREVRERLQEKAHRKMQPQRNERKNYEKRTRSRTSTTTTSSSSSTPSLSTHQQRQILASIEWQKENAITNQLAKAMLASRKSKASDATQAGAGGGAVNRTNQIFTDEEIEISLGALLREI